MDTMAFGMPVRPPIKNMRMPPKVKSMGELNLIAPLCKVATQLKIFIPVGTATKRVV
jgi:hypothetical protein